MTLIESHPLTLPGSVDESNKYIVRGRKANRQQMREEDFLKFKRYKKGVPPPPQAVDVYLDLQEILGFKFEEISLLTKKQIKGQGNTPTSISLAVDKTNMEVTWTPGHELFRYGLVRRGSFQKRVSSLPHRLDVRKEMKDGQNATDDDLLVFMLQQCKTFYSQEHFEDMKIENKAELKQQFTFRTAPMDPRSSEVSRLLVDRPVLRRGCCSQPIFIPNSILERIYECCVFVDCANDKERHDTDGLITWLVRFELFLEFLYENKVTRYYNALIKSKTYEDACFNLRLIKSDAQSNLSAHNKILLSVLSGVVTVGMPLVNLLMLNAE